MQVARSEIETTKSSDDGEWRDSADPANRRDAEDSSAESIHGAVSPPKQVGLALLFPKYSTILLAVIRNF
jgi:hypothetical protein